MLERDDEDLAIEQLPGAGRADDPDAGRLAGARSRASTGARRPHSQSPRSRPRRPARSCGSWASASSSCRRSFGRCRSASSSASRTSTDARSRLISQRERTRRAARGAARAPTAIRTRAGPPRRRAHPPDQRAARPASDALDARARAARLISRASWATCPRCAQSAMGSSTRSARSSRERTAVRDELVERELHAPAPPGSGTPSVSAPMGRGPREVWEHGVRLAARYRVEHDITDPGDALGPQPEQREQQRELGACPQGDRAGPAPARPRSRGRARCRSRDRVLSATMVRLCPYGRSCQCHD